MRTMEFYYEKKVAPPMQIMSSNRLYGETIEEFNVDVKLASDATYLFFKLTTYLFRKI